MKMEDKIIKTRKEISDALKYISSLVNNPKEIPEEMVDTILTRMQSGLTIVKTLDWILDDKDIELVEFCEKIKDKDLAEEFGFDVFIKDEE